MSTHDGRSNVRRQICRSSGQDPGSGPAVLVAAAGQLSLTARAEARPSSCFWKDGQPRRQVQQHDGSPGLPGCRLGRGDRRHRDRQALQPDLRRRWPSGHPCRQGTSFTDAGPGNDRIVLHPKSNDNQVHGGAGDDEIDGSSGNDFIYGSPVACPPGSATATTWSARAATITFTTTGEPATSFAARPVPTACTASAGGLPGARRQRHRLHLLQRRQEPKRSDRESVRRAGQRPHPGRPDTEQRPRLSRRRRG